MFFMEGRNVNKRSMKWRLLITYIILSLVLTGCKGCLSKLYAVHEEPVYDDIIFYAPSIKPAALLQYLDHEPPGDTAFYEVRDTFSGLELGERDRVIHFKQDPEEYCWLTVDKNPCNIIAFRNDKIDPSWKFTTRDIGGKEADRIGGRFLRTILFKLTLSANFSIGAGGR